MTSTLPVIIALLIGLSFWPESAWADTSHEILQAKVQSLVEKLENQEEHERRTAAESLGDFGEGARPAVPPLVRALNDEVADVRAAVADALGRIGADANAAVPALISSLKDQDPAVRSTVTAALSQFPKKGALIAPALGELLDDPDESVRLAAASTLGGLSSEGVLVLRDILQQHPDPSVRVTALSALGGTGIYAERALSELLAALDQPIADMRRAAAIALGKVASDTTWPETRPWRDRSADPLGYDPKPIWPRPMRTPIRQTLYTRLHNSVIEVTIPALSEILDDPEPAVRAAALRALSSIGSESEPAIPFIIEMMGDGNPNVRRAAATALGNIGGPSKHILQGLIVTLADKDNDVQLAASRSITKMGGASVRLLIKAMENPDPSVRLLVAATLENLGNEAVLAIPALSQALHDDEHAVRLAATYALEAIEEISKSK